MEYCSKGDIAKWNKKKLVFEHKWDIKKELVHLLRQAAEGLANCNIDIIN